MSRQERERMINRMQNRVHARIAGQFERVFLNEFSLFESHVQFAKLNLARALEKFEEDYKRYADADLDSPEWVDDMMEEDRDVLVEILPRLQWYAQFLVVYSAFEDALNELCNVVKRRSNFDLAFEDMHGQGINRAKTYLVKVARVKSPFESQLWQDAVLFGKVRNAIAHSNGRIANVSDGSSLAVQALRLNGFEFHASKDSKVGRIKIGDTFVVGAIGTLQRILIQICDYELYSQ